jgi:hypothetical protein
MADITLSKEHWLSPDMATAPPAGQGAAPVVACYDNRVPAFVEAELERLYGSIYASIGMFRFDGSLAAASTYAVWTEGRLTTLLLYRRENDIVTVLNGSIALTQEEIERFAATMFARYRAVSAVAFNAISTEISRSAYPCQQYHYGEDIVVTLPSSPTEYLASLGKNMRETVKRYMNRLKRTYPSFHLEVQIDGQADAQQIRELFRLHRARIENKNEVVHLGEAEIEDVIALAQRSGLVTIATIDGKVCGGMVCWRAGANYFMRTVAHDPQYDDAKLGTLCCYLTICECIARGGKAFHFSPGRMIYKYRFLGVEQYFDRVVLYRSRARMLLNCRYALRNAVRGAVKEAKLWLMDAELRDDPRSRAAVRGLRSWRAFKQAGSLAQKIAAARTAWAAFETEPARAASCSVTAAEATQELLLRRLDGARQVAVRH